MAKPTPSDNLPYNSSTWFCYSLNQYQLNEVITAAVDSSIYLSSHHIHYLHLPFFIPDHNNILQ